MFRASSTYVSDLLRHGCLSEGFVAVLCYTTCGIVLDYLMYQVGVKGFVMTERSPLPYSVSSPKCFHPREYQAITSWIHHPVQHCHCLVRTLLPLD
jgi:hypothetical protein